MRVMGLVAAALMVAACGNGGSAVETRDRAREPGDPPPATAAADVAGDASAPVAEAERGRPVWAANRRSSGEENAQARFERNGEDFGTATVEAYVSAAHAFVSNPPPGTETARRRNGDTLYYHAASNTFAVATRDGAPRTMFKPREGAAYWAQQQAQLERGGDEG